ncbi:hypothetical protein [Psychromicrobium lacuslunae]|uniref:PPM-type phosphatase domain-containing protein n=1 Tax=Psychromicrobium lacuslunae TaxID=1618207 RepID=A0A0D4BYI4_9MICC|nr:hypothetical protein [Psychromicrobium lacuslunae]AJT41492.1 hypothetical protein UM93_08150 [Psychromicrobium lacuslunae]
MRWRHLVRVQTEGDNHPMEDACGFAGGLAWMIDGATSVLEPLGLPASTDPAWLAAALNIELAAAESSIGPVAGQEFGARELLGRALQGIDRQAGSLVGSESIRFPSAALSLAQLRPDGVEVLSLADCHVVVQERGGGLRHVISSLADPGASWTLEELAASRRRRNSPEGLWVARREPEAADHALVVQCGFPERLVMASDGAWRAVDLGLVGGPAEFLETASDPLAAQQLMTELRRHQREIGEKADDASLLVLAPESD